MQKLCDMARDFCAAMLAIYVSLAVSLLVLVIQAAWCVGCCAVLASALVWQLWLVVIGEE